ncbi:MAG: tRNA pseudouridine(38-40) synthase TruA [Bacteriovoracaceae bacterium]
MLWASLSNISNMFAYKLILSYQGTAYFGWQIQKADQQTIQGTLENCLKQICKSENIKTIGSGRTDAGVHALNQVVRIEIPLNIEAQALVRALNSFLPLDIRVKSATVIEDEFHPIFSAKKKEYIYLFNVKEPTPFQRNLVTHVPYDLDLESMKKAASVFVGEYDFCNFYTIGTNVKSTVRTVFRAEIVHYSAGAFQEQFPEVFALKIEGSGFLKQMVRLIMGTIWEAGRGKIGVEEIRKHLKGESFSKKLAAVAPPQGLYLSFVSYE